MLERQSTIVVSRFIGLSSEAGKRLNARSGNAQKAGLMVSSSMRISKSAIRGGELAGIAVELRRSLLLKRAELEEPVFAPLRAWPSSGRDLVGNALQHRSLVDAIFKRESRDAAERVNVCIEFDAG